MKILTWEDGTATSRDMTLAEVAELEDKRQPDITLWRSTTSCSRMQGILALGQAKWAIIQTYKATATWGEQMVIDGSSVWYRHSQNVAFFGYLLGLTDTQVDDLFKIAVMIEA